MKLEALTDLQLRKKIRWYAGRLNALHDKMKAKEAVFYKLTAEADKRRAEGKYQ